MVNKGNMRKWVEALRSGEFEQGRGALAQRHYRDDWRYCCLGVACEVAISDGLELEVNDLLKARLYDGYSDFLPSSVMGWLGLSSDDIPLDSRDDGGVLRAIEANDRLEWSFEQIADAVEKYYELDKEWQHG